MLGRDRTVLRGGQAVHGVRDARVIGGEEVGRSHVLGPQRVEVHVAVAHVAVDHHARIGCERQHFGRGIGNEVGDLRQRDRDVALDAAAGACLRIRDFLAQQPEGARVGNARGNRGVGHQAALHALFENRHQRRVQAFGVAARGQLDQHHPVMGAGQRCAELRHGFQHQRQRRARDQLEGRDGLAGHALGFGQQFDGGMRVFHRDPGRGRGAGQRHQLEHGGGDDAQRAFGAYEQLLEVIAGVVLAQSAQRRVDAAIGQHGFDAQRQVAHVAVAQHRGAAGVGREIAADLARAFGTYAQREQAPRVFGRGARSLQRHAGLQRHRVVDDIDFLHLVHAAQIEHHGVANGIGHGAAHQRGVAALGHDRHVVLEAQRQHFADLLRVRRQHDGQRLAVVQLAVVGGEGLHVAGDFNAGFLADDGTQAFKHQRVGNGGSRGHVQ